MKSRYGVKLTKSEQKAMDVEIKRELAKWDDDHLLEIDAMTLWILHEEFGFGPARLKQFFDRFCSGMDELKERYQLEYADQIWLCTKKLKEYGVDLQQWIDEKLKESV